MIPGSHEPSCPRHDGADPAVEFGRYQLLRVIGRGGMGQVFEAWDPQLERRVAIKVMTHARSDELAFHEARCLARVAHPNVVCVHDVGRVDHLVFIAMELVDGPDLARWLCARPRPWTSVLDCIVAAGLGLAAVHDAGLVHGDVKPGNVVVGRGGRVRLADFGLARVRPRAADPELAASVRRAAAEVEAQLGPVLAQRSRDAPDASGMGLGPGLWGSPEQGAGTTPYMAPECLAGVGHDPARADQYSLCATAWEALFGARPYAGGSAQTILGSIAAGRLQRGAGGPPGMPRAIEAALRRGLSDTPQQRWPSVPALLDALARARQPEPVRAVLRLVRAWLSCSRARAPTAGRSQQP